MPGMSEDPVELLLRGFACLRMDGTRVSVVAERIARLTDWDRFVRQVEYHGLAPLIVWHVQRAELVLPGQCEMQLKALVMRHRAAADVRYEVMRKLMAALEQRQVSVLALKGLALANLLYPLEWLRPMRDIDLLYSREQEDKLREGLAAAGFALPEDYADRYQRGSNQLPEAVRTEGAYTISLDLHHDAIGRDSSGRLHWRDVRHPQSFMWRDMALTALGHEQMLVHLCRHLADRHPGSYLKLINVVDVVAYAEAYCDELDWPALTRNHAHVINTLKCLHFLTPLSATLRSAMAWDESVAPAGVGQIMPQLKDALRAPLPWRERLGQVFLPSAWWLHLHYGVPPERSIVFVRCLRHPAAVMAMLGRRFWSAILGG